MDTLTTRWKQLSDASLMPPRSAHMLGAMHALDLLRLGVSRAVLMAECREFFAEPKCQKRQFDSAPGRVEP